MLAEARASCQGCDACESTGGYPIVTVGAPRRRPFYSHGRACQARPDPSLPSSFRPPPGHGRSSPTARRGSPLRPWRQAAACRVTVGNVPLCSAGGHRLSASTRYIIPHREAGSSMSEAKRRIATMARWAHSGLPGLRPAGSCPLAAPAGYALGRLRRGLKTKRVFVT
jgi:hypothetical protein